jgi:hypothetical protein
MKRVALLSSEPLGPRMGGIGVRYLEMARRLPAFGFDVLVISPAPVAEAVACGLDPAQVRKFDRDRVVRWIRGYDAVVAQGQLANDLLLHPAGVPIAIDLYDPWLIENLHYAESLGLDPYRVDHAAWTLQLSRGDFFLCSSAEQRLFYLGLLTALGRVNPRRLASDPDLSGLIAAVPFGCEPAAARRGGVLPPRSPGERRLLFGAIYDWYDTPTMLAALDRVETADWTLFVVTHPDPGATPQSRFSEFAEQCRLRGWWGSRVRAIDRVAAADRGGLFDEVDALVAPHVASLESELSFRTRFLEALAAGCPAVASQGGTIARLLAERDAGWVVPVGDAPALAAAIDDVLSGGDRVAARVERGRGLAAEYSWDRALAPLVEFLSSPMIDPTKEAFAFRPSTLVPRDGLAFRIRRRWRRGWS